MNKEQSTKPNTKPSLNKRKAKINSSKYAKAIVKALNRAKLDK